MLEATNEFCESFPSPKEHYLIWEVLDPLTVKVQRVSITITKYRRDLKGRLREATVLVVLGKLLYSSRWHILHTLYCHVTFSCARLLFARSPTNKFTLKPGVRIAREFCERARHEDVPIQKSILITSDVVLRQKNLQKWDPIRIVLKCEAIWNNYQNTSIQTKLRVCGIG